ncbi:MAG: GNAT family N-acetyltransferase [Candidatus Hodarchaeota archaeon]
MVFELPKSMYESVRSLFDGKNDHMGAISVIEQTIPGRIWVDDITNPLTACLWDMKGHLYLGGKAEDGFSSSIGQLIDGEIAAEATKQDITTFILHCPPETVWEEQLSQNKLFENLRKQTRRYFIFKELKVPWKEEIPLGYSVERIDKKILTNANLRNLEGLIHEINIMNHSQVDFLERGFGFCVINEAENAIVSWCTSEYHQSKERLACDFGIETVEEYQKQGFGTLAAAAAVDYGSSNGFQMGWDTWIDNIASQRLAEKVGFEKAKDYPIYCGCFNKHLHQLVNSYYALRVKKNPRKAAEGYQQAFQKGKCEAFHLFTAACAFNQLGETATALNYLHEAVDKGWTDIAHKDLQNLYNTPTWEEIKEKIALEKKEGKADS